MTLGNLYLLLLPKNLPLELEVNKISSWQNFSTKIIFLPIGSNNYQKLIVNIYFFPFVMVANYPYNIKNCWLRGFMKMDIIFWCIFRAKVTPNRKKRPNGKKTKFGPTASHCQLPASDHQENRIYQKLDWAFLGTKNTAKQNFQELTENCNFLEAALSNLMLSL